MNGLDFLTNVVRDYRGCQAGFTPNNCLNQKFTRI